MGRKKRLVVALKPFCYYCDKEFNNEIILHQHQKARHFYCRHCRKRFSTAPALDTHMLQVHKEKLSRVPNAKATRDGFDISIYGMDGVPIGLVNIKLAERVAAKKRKLIRENKMLADEEDLKEEKRRKKKGYKEKEIDMTQIKALGFYHNPDSINLTLNASQMNSMYNPSVNISNIAGNYLGVMNSSMNMTQQTQESNTVNQFYEA